MNWYNALNIEHKGLQRATFMYPKVHINVKKNTAQKYPLKQNSKLRPIKVI